MNKVYVIDYIYKLSLINFSNVTILDLLNITLINDGNIRGHAYGVIGIMLDINPKANIIFIPINLTSTSEDIIYILNYILENTYGGIINISFGFTNIRDKEKLHEIIKKINGKDMLIICADSNDGQIVYPASYKEVITINTSHYEKYHLDNNMNIMYLDKRNYIKVPWIHNKFFHSSDSSYLTAYVSGVASLMSTMSTKNLDITNLYNIIIERIIKNV